MLHYYLWTIGCQMNQADSHRLAGLLEGMGYEAATSPETADLVLLNTCVVRQSAEDRALSQIGTLKAMKQLRPNMTIALTGCLVDSNLDSLKRHFPHVDIFFPPQGFDVLEAWARDSINPPPIPIDRTPASPTAFVSVIHGCDSFCTYCIVPFRRGRERSRPVDEIVCEVEGLIRRGVREVTLLGQKVDAYGHDLPGPPDLADLLERLNSLRGLERIRFLTSHPQFMTPRLIQALAQLEKVCEHVNLPVQSGDDAILKSMRRGYSIQEYCQLVNRLRQAVPGVALSTDVIVGYPGETELQFQHTLELIQQIRFDKVHVACYSPRSGTWASRHLRDDVPSMVKKQRQCQVEAVQKEIAGQINQQLIGKTGDVLVEGGEKGRWRGRTRTDKLVFFESDGSRHGQLINIRIIKAGPFWLEGTVCGD